MSRHLGIVHRADGSSESVSFAAEVIGLEGGRAQRLDVADFRTDDGELLVLHPQDGVSIDLERIISELRTPE